MAESTTHPTLAQRFNSLKVVLALALWLLGSIGGLIGYLKQPDAFTWFPAYVQGVATAGLSVVLVLAGARTVAKQNGEGNK